MIDEEVSQHYLEQTKNIIKELESNNMQEANRLLDELANTREQHLFRELGKLTREFHDALNSFRLDSRLTKLAGEDIPDAKERLNFVIHKTEEAANKTLNVVEDVLPICERVSDATSELNSKWERFNKRDMNVEEFRELSKNIAGFFSELDTDVTTIKNGLNDVLMAQDFQDITGQIIGRVITLVSDLEDGLVNLIRISGGVSEDSAKEEKSNPNKLDGPQVPGLESDTAVSGQDEVDDLLSSLGF